MVSNRPRETGLQGQVQAQALFLACLLGGESRIIVRVWPGMQAHGAPAGILLLHGTRALRQVQC